MVSNGRHFNQTLSPF